MSCLILGTLRSQAAVSFAVGCGFHRIGLGPAMQFGSDERLSVIPPPQDEAEIIQRIRMWHSIFMVRQSLYSHAFVNVASSL